MSITSGEATPSYQVVGVTPGQYSQDGAGNTVQGHIIHYQLADGTTGQVFVPDRQWSVSSAQAAVEDAVRTTYAVRNLGSTGM